MSKLMWNKVDMKREQQLKLLTYVKFSANIYQTLIYYKEY